MYSRCGVKWNIVIHVSLSILVEAYYKAFSVQDDTQQENVDVNGNSTITTTKSQLEASLAEQLVVDLEDGVLTNNLGVPIIIVCTKV